MDTRLIFRDFFVFSDGRTELSSLSDLLDYRFLLKGVSQANPRNNSPRVEKRLIYGSADSSEQASKKNL